MGVSELMARRAVVLRELAGLTQVRRGSVTEQVVKTVDPDGRTARRGPYPLLTYKEKGRTVSRRLRDPEEVARCRRQIENFRRFEALTRELREIGEALCEKPEASAEKKRPRSPSSRTRK